MGNYDKPHGHYFIQRLRNEPYLHTNHALVTRSKSLHLEQPRIYDAMPICHVRWPNYFYREEGQTPREGVSTFLLSWCSELFFK